MNVHEKLNASFISDIYCLHIFYTKTECIIYIRYLLSAHILY